MNLASTGKIVSMFLNGAKYKISDLAKASNVSEKTIYRLINDEGKMTIDIAIGLNKLISAISVEYIMDYDSKYQTQKELYLRENNIKNVNDYVTDYKLKKFFPELATKSITLYEIGDQIFDFKNNTSAIKIANNLCFDKAANSDKDASKMWIIISYSEYMKEYSLAKEFNRRVFDDIFPNLKTFANTDNINLTIFNMQCLCDKCGINFYYRPSVPNSRIKGVSFKTVDGKVFILVSDLFKCVENLWLTFVHEMIHIKNDDIEKSLKESEMILNEKFVSNAACEYFVSTKYNLENENSYREISNIAEANNVSVGMAAEIYRHKKRDYSDARINKLVHYYKSTDINYISPFSKPYLNN